MKYCRFFIMFFILISQVCLSASLRPPEKESKTNDFIYNGELIHLSLYAEKEHEKVEKRKYGGNVFYIDKSVFYGYDVWSGGFSKEGDNNFGIFYSKKDRVINLIGTNYGFFIEHKTDLYALSFKRFDQHSTVTSLYKILRNEDGLGVRKIFELPGIVEWFDNARDELIVYGGVNDNPFAASVDSKGEWHKLRYVPRRDSY